jgi:hypothetical protein
MCKRDGRGVVIEQACGVGWYVPTDCGDPLCGYCERQRAAERFRRWRPTVEAMRSPRHIVLTQMSGPDLAERVKAYRRSFRRFMDTRLGPRIWPELQDAAAVFAEKHFRESFERGEITDVERAGRVAEWAERSKRFGKRLESYHTRNKDKKGRGKWPRIRDLIGKGFAHPEITIGKDDLWYVHSHLCTDGVYIPWPVMCVSWLRASKGEDYIVSVKAMNSDDLAEMVKYLTKPWEIPDEKRAEFRKAVKGLKRIVPLGGAVPDKSKPPCPFCHKSGCGGHLVGIGDEWTKETIGGKEVIGVLTTDGLGKQAILYFASDEEGRWRSYPLYLIPKDLACHSQPIRGP